jgi:hypothetical protein
MTDKLAQGYTGESDTTPDETISEAMQGGTGEMNADGLSSDFGAEQVAELGENLSELAEKGE